MKKWIDKVEHVICGDSIVKGRFYRANKTVPDTLKKSSFNISGTLIFPNLVYCNKDLSSQPGRDDFMSITGTTSYNFTISDSSVNPNFKIKPIELQEYTGEVSTENLLNPSIINLLNNADNEISNRNLSISQQNTNISGDRIYNSREFGVHKNRYIDERTYNEREILLGLLNGDLNGFGDRNLVTAGVRNSYGTAHHLRIN